MKLKIYEVETEKKPKRKFCLLPTKAVDGRLELGVYIVWLEWVDWNIAYNSWILTKQVK